MVEKKDLVKVTIISHLNTNKYSVHDGPGYLSQVLQAIRKRKGKIVFKATMFQVSIVVSVPHREFQNDQKRVKIVYSPQEQEAKIKKVSNNSTSDIFMPNKKCCQRPILCFVKFVTHPGYILNITFFNFKHQGVFNTVLCNNAGIKIFHFDGMGDFQEGTHAHTICVQNAFSSHSVGSVAKDNVTKTKFNMFYNFKIVRSISPDQTESLTAYSKDSSVTVVFYMYPEYYNFVVNISVKAIKCSYLKFFSRLVPTSSCQVTQITYFDFSNSLVCRMKKIVIDPGSQYAYNISTVFSGVMKGNQKYYNIPSLTLLPFCRCQDTQIFSCISTKEIFDGFVHLFF